MRRSAPLLALLVFLIGCTNTPPANQTSELDSLRVRVAALEQQNTQLKGELDDLRQHNPLKPARFELTLDPKGSANSHSTQAYTVIARPHDQNTYTGSVRAGDIQVGAATTQPATRPASQNLRPRGENGLDLIDDRPKQK